MALKAGLAWVECEDGLFEGVESFAGCEGLPVVGEVGVLFGTPVFGAGHGDGDGALETDLLILRLVVVRYQSRRHDEDACNVNLFSIFIQYVSRLESCIRTSTIGLPPSCTVLLYGFHSHYYDS